MIAIRTTSRHFLTYTPDALRDDGRYRKLSTESWDFLSALADEDARHVTLATEDGDLVGWFRCTVVRGLLYAQGTWVSKTYRRQGSPLDSGTMRSGLSSRPACA